MLYGKFTFFRDNYKLRKSVSAEKRVVREFYSQIISF